MEIWDLYTKDRVRTGRQIRRLQGYLRGGQDKSFDNYAQLRIRELQDRFRADNAPSF